MTVKTGVDFPTLVDQINTDISNATTTTYTVSSQEAMLALSANKGDIAIRTDTKTNYVLSATPASTLANWVELEQNQSLIPSTPYSMHIAGGENPVSSITLVGEPCSDVNAILVLVEHTVVPTNSYTLNSSGTVLTFTSAVPAGLDIDLRWYSQLSVSPSNPFANPDLSNLSSTGKHYVGFKGYDSNETYSLNDIVVNVNSNNEVKLYQSLANNNTSSLSDTTKWEEVSLGGGGASRNIGEIVISTVPLVDAGLHLADGALISGSGSYAGFVTDMAGLVSTHPELFDTEANWQSSVSTYGVCGKYVYDSVNNTIRLPKIEGFIEGTTDATALGDLIRAGLPNITGSFGCDYTNTTRLSGAMYAKSTYSGATYAISAITATEVGLNASRSSSIYGNSSTVQPQAINVFYYVVIATTTKTDIQVDIDEIATDLNGKADTDLSNLSNGLANTLCTTAATTTSSASSARPAVVVRNYRSGENWFRVWSDGWIEQGGAQTNTTGGSTSYGVSLLYPFATTDYTVMRAPLWGASWASAGSDGYTVGILSKATTYFVCATHASSYVTKIMWYACGY